MKDHFLPTRMQSKRQTTASVDEAMANLELSYTVGENVKYYSRLGKQLVISLKVKHEFTTQSSNPTPTYVLKRNESICPHLYMKVPSSITHNRDIAGIQLSINW